jgi:hypothetical protein
MEKNSKLHLYCWGSDDLIYVTDEIYSVKHPSLVCGQPVKAAGTFNTQYGEIDWISNESGHYKPTLQQAKQFANHIGVDVSKVRQL